MKSSIGSSAKSLIALVLSASGGLAWAGPPALPSPGDVSLSSIPVCYGFGCKRLVTVDLPLDEWRGVAGWFEPAASAAAQERAQIRQAIGWMESVIGRHAPTGNDLAFDLPPSGDAPPGQQDCIDEAVNTTSYLKLFEMNGLLKHHVVVEAAYRRSWLDQHWAGQVREKHSGKRFVIDSWFHPNGYLPVVQASARWQNISRLSAVVDNSDGPDGDATKRSFWRRLLRGELR